MSLNPGIILIFGISVFGGILSAGVIKRLSIPQVLGYIITGIIIGQSGLRLVGADDIEMLMPFNFIALGIIGFLVGSEIRFRTLKKYSRQFSSILLGEGVLAFLLVGISVAFVMYRVTGSVSTAIAAGIVFGAIASATDPASTISVLWEYKAAGILTTTLIAVVALDDALAMSLYGIGTGIARILSGEGTQLTTEIIRVCIELFGSVGIGVLSGFVINIILRRSLLPEQAVAAALGILLLLVGIAEAGNMDIILAAMAGGITVVNSAPKRSKELIEHLKSFSVPIYVLFFVLVGARMTITAMPGWLWIIITFYVIGRSLGKMGGAWIGARLSGAEPVVRRYTGMGLFAQGGVAIGLSIMASHHLNTVSVGDSLYLGDVIIFGITTTTFIVQIAGPPFTKLAIRLAGEIGKNISEADIIKKMKVENAIRNSTVVCKEETPLRRVFTFFSQATIPFMPVVNKKNELTGILSMEELKEVIVDQSCWDWIVASDIMETEYETVAADASLSHAISLMNQLQSNQLPVVRNNAFAGVVDRKHINAQVRKEILSLHATV